MPRPRSGWRVGLVLLAWATGACGGGSGSTTAPSGSAAVRLHVAEVPLTVTEIRLTVTGDGMPPLERRIALHDTATFLELSPGRRTFEVTVKAKGKTFSGSTTQEIRLGQHNLVEVRVRVNEAPAVRISADRPAVFPGGAIRLTCAASDPDGDPVAISWRASGGSVSATSGPTTGWSSPARDRYTITCAATDPKGRRRARASRSAP